MTRALAGVVLTLLLASPSAARGDMIDYFFKYASATAAKADAVMLAGQYDNVNAAWVADHVLPNLECWRPSQDTQVANPTPPPATITQHADIAGFLVLVSVDSPAPIAALLNDAALQFALNRTHREAGQAFVVKNNIGAVISDIACQPLFQMRNYYPAGNFN